MPNEIESPGELQIHGRPRGVTRFNKLPVLIGGGIVTVFLVAVMFGLNERNAQGNAAANDPNAVNPRLKAEAFAGKEIAKDAPTGLLTVAKPAPELRLESPKKPEPPRLEDSPPPLVGKAPPPPVPAPIAASPAQPAAPSAEEEARRKIFEEMEKVRVAAWSSGSTVDLAPKAALPGRAADAGAPGRPNLQQFAEQAKALGLVSPTSPAGASAGTPQLALPGTGQEADQNKQERKEQFLGSAQTVPESHYVKSTRTPAIAPYEIKAGWVIPAVMEHGINSDLPGQLTARVTQNVFDSATGQHLLIPQGTRLVGNYDSQIAYGQERLLVVWRRLIFPDSSSMSLGGMGGVDESGYAGFADQVNHHYLRIFGFGLLTSVFSAAFQLSIPKNAPNQFGSATQTNQQVIASSVGTEMARLGTEIARKNLNIQPTIEIRPGYRFNVRVEKDLLMPKPYAYANVQ